MAHADGPAPETCTSLVRPCRRARTIASTLRAKSLVRHVRARWRVGGAKELLEGGSRRHRVGGRRACDPRGSRDTF
eukprot:scaffold1744_cov340-Prasinococcus_capsulatus_cf.AAC.18